MEEVDERILVVIPYCSVNAQGKELDYAVAGWRKHFKENYIIVVVGEYHPVCDSGDDIVYVESPRVDAIPGMYRQHLDYVSCMRKVQSVFPNSTGFVWVADDVYAVNDFCMTDILLLKQQGDVIPGHWFDTNDWLVDKAKTREALLKDGYPVRDFSTHLPQYCEWDKISRLWDKYNMDTVSYVFEDLYYNIYYQHRPALQLMQGDNIKFGIYTDSITDGELKEAFIKNIWIQNSEAGWSSNLDKLLALHFDL